MTWPMDPRAARGRSTWPLACGLLLVLTAAAIARSEWREGSDAQPLEVTDEWRGFRGQERQGVGAATESPIAWSPSQNVSWKTDLQGSGHSSPIISGQHVYVTTAFESEDSKQLLQAARWLRLGLCLVALTLWLRLPPIVAPWQEVAYGGLLAAFVMLALADEQLLRVERSPSRAWLGAGTSLLVGLLMSAYGLDRLSWARRAVGLALGLLAVGLVAARPAGIDESWALSGALGVLTAAAAAGCVLVLRGTLPSAPSVRTSVPLIVAGIVTVGSLALIPVTGPLTPLLAVGAALLGIAARGFLGVTPSGRTSRGWDEYGIIVMPRRTRPSAPVWRTCVLFAAGLGFAIPTVLAPRSGWVYALACLDRATGRVLWITEGLRAAPAAVHSANSRATPTAVTDGRHVFAYFGSAGVMAVDTEGSLLWTNSRVPFQTIYGVGASPVLAENILLLSGYTAAAPYLAAFDVLTGRELWRVARPSVHPEFGDSRTPLVRIINGRPTVVVWGRAEIAGHDLSTGQVSWRYAFEDNYQMGSMVSSLVASGDLLYLPLENGIVALSASNLAAGRDPVVWKSRGGGSALTTPVKYHGRIFAVSAVGVASCTDAGTGSVLWRTRLDGEYHSAPVAAAGKVYFTNEAGKTTVVASASDYKVLAENDLGERVVATIAPVGGDLYVRTLNRLYRIGP